MFQEARLLPWKRVWRNVALGLKVADPRERALAALDEVGLSHRIDAWPATLSGGEAQRTALARALVREPELLLLDEPFAALDALTRIKMHGLVQALWRKHQPAVLLVTHDVDEALLLADRVLVLDGGRIAAEERVELERPRTAADRAFQGPAPQPARPSRRRDARAGGRAPDRPGAPRRARRWDEPPACPARGVHRRPGPPAGQRGRRGGRAARRPSPARRPGGRGRLVAARVRPAGPRALSPVPAPPRAARPVLHRQLRLGTRPVDPDSRPPVWGLVGVLRGAELSQRFRIPDAGGPIALGPPDRLEAGAVEAVSPTIGDVHRVANAYDDRVSVSIHVYGADIGAVQRWVYPQEGGRKAFVSGYNNTDANPPFAVEAVERAA
ncbi:MAG: ATP-binding cassette domain-containing protein [Caulobacteraceae bacterium]